MQSNTGPYGGDVKPKALGNPYGAAAPKQAHNPYGGAHSTFENTNCTRVGFFLKAALYRVRPEKDGLTVCVACLVSRRSLALLCSSPLLRVFACFV